MNIHTIEGTFEFRIADLVRQMIRDFGPSSLTTEDELINFLAIHSKALGDLLVEDMANWTDNWLEQVKEISR